MAQNVLYGLSFSKEHWNLIFDKTPTPVLLSNFRKIVFFRFFFKDLDQNYYFRKYFSLIVNTNSLIKDLLQISVLILSEFKRINFHRPWDHEKT